MQSFLHPLPPFSQKRIEILGNRVGRSIPQSLGRGGGEILQNSNPPFT